MRLDSYPTVCPLVNRRTLGLMLRLDPLGIGKPEPYHFDLEVFDQIETSSRAVARLDGRAIRDSSTYCDAYRLGSSQDEARADAERMAAEWDQAGIEVVVETTLISTPVFLDTEKEAFYADNVQVFTVPGHWQQLHPEPASLAPTRILFTTWRNGAATPEQAALDVCLNEARAGDQVAHLRTARR